MYSSEDLNLWDYVQGSIQTVDQAAQGIVANTQVITAVGVSTQILGFDAGGNPTAKNVAGDTNGIGLAFSGDTLTASLSQDLKASASPTFNGLTVTNQATLGDLKVGTGPVIKNTTAGTINIDPGSISGQARGDVAVTVSGVSVGDFVVLSPPVGLNVGLVYGGCRVTGADTLTVFLANLTSGTIDDGANNWEYFWVDLT